MDKASLYEVIGANIRAARRAKKLTQEQLATLVELSRASVTNVELGRQSILVDQLFRFAKALDTTPEALIARAADQPARKREADLTPALTAWLQHFEKRI